MNTRIKNLPTLIFGIAFAAVDIPVFGFDILPDIVGYFLVFFSSTLLAEEHFRFKRVRNISLPLLICETSSVFKLSGTGFTVFLALLITLLGLYVMYYIFSAISHMAQDIEEENIAITLNAAFFFYAPSVLLPFVSALLPDIDKLCYFISVCVSLFLLNTLIRAYKKVYLPIPAEPGKEPATQKEYISEGITEE